MTESRPEVVSQGFSEGTCRRASKQAMLSMRENGSPLKVFCVVFLNGFYRVVAD
jgi:hypothetical protein